MRKTIKLKSRLLKRQVMPVFAFNAFFLPLHGLFLLVRANSPFGLKHARSFQQKSPASATKKANVRSIRHGLNVPEIAGCFSGMLS
ncbi:MAG: hypothetical protein M0Z75_11225 [Nitrospiraceae bacterium]|nr:hypothetical protein [Nitrospiraceae bacterium]